MTPDIRETQKVIDRIRTGGVTLEELIRFLANNAALIRANAVIAIGKQYSSVEAVTSLEQAATDNRNDVLLLGRSIRVLAIGSLLSMRRIEATEAAKRCISKLPSGQIENLSIHLQAEGLTLP